ncbi:MAG TPA: 50S ribosomal protein L21 [Pirellulales bacterium]|jgi:large subunit ribosomal protein L21|nr:50S ribosomal protein L21 [Pirellulales bacterium]
MYAIISDGGRQYKVEEGQELVIDYREVSAGSELSFDRVLACGGDGETKLGQPVLEGASVKAEVLGPELGPKLVVQKKRRRKNMQRKNGHRQLNTRVRISRIEA